MLATKYLFWGIACCAILNSCEPLLAYNTNNNNDFIILTNSIYDFLLRGYPINEIGEILDDDQKNSYNIEKLIKRIEELLSKQSSKDNIINIITNSKESEEFFARINFWTKITTRYFIVKALICLVISIILLYLLYRWFNFKSPWFPNENPPKPNDKPNINKDQKFDNSQDSGGSKSQPDGTSSQSSNAQNNYSQNNCSEGNSFKTNCPVTNCLQANCLPSNETQTNQASSRNAQSLDVAIQAAQEVCQSQQEKVSPATQSKVQAEDQQSQEPEQHEGLDEILDDRELLDKILEKDIEKQIANARSIGLDCTAIQHERNKINVEPEDDEYLFVRILQQLEHAKSIGLIPANKLEN
jgi:hypothetical protein